MTMTVDEALKHADNDIERDDTRCMQTLAAEVRRLRAELAEATRQLETCRKGSNSVLGMIFDLAVNQDDCPSVELALHRANVAHKAGWTLANQAEVVLAKEVERLQKVVADQALTIGTLKDSLAKARSSLEEYEEKFGPLIHTVSGPKR